MALALGALGLALDLVYSQICPWMMCLYKLMHFIFRLSVISLQCVYLQISCTWINLFITSLWVLHAAAILLV